MTLTLFVRSLESKLMGRSVQRSVGRLASTFRYRDACAEVKEPACSEEHLAEQEPCEEKKLRLAKGLPPPENPFMWENPECCKESCVVTPRYDELYYKPSDKLKREYQQTWVACPDLRIEEVTVCCNDALDFPPREKRLSKRQMDSKAPTSCAKVSAQAMPCKAPPAKSKCPYVPLPDCAGRVPPTCPKRRILDDCLREKTPYPSFSDCQKDEIDPPKATECRCLDPVFMCEVWAEYRRRLKLN